MDGRTEEMMIESITIAGYDGGPNTTSTIPMSSVTGHHGGTPAGSFGSSGLSSIPESSHPSEPGYHRSHSNNSSRPPKTAPKFFRINKKRLSGDSQSWLANKDGRGSNAAAEGCVVNTALLQKQPQNSVELTARSGSTTNLSGLWSGNNTNLSNTNLTPNTNNSPNYPNSGSTTPQHPNTSSDHLQPSGTIGTIGASAWKQGWIPEEEMDDAPMPSLLTTSRSYNTVINPSGQSPLLTPMDRYKQQQLVHQDGSSSAPSSTVNLSSPMNNNGSAPIAGFSPGFGHSADEREDWSGDDGDGDDEGDGYLDQNHQHLHSKTGTHSSASYQQFQQQVQMNQQQYSRQPYRSASAVPFSTSSNQAIRTAAGGLNHSQSSHPVPSAGSRYKQRSTGLLSGTNFGSGIGAMTTMDDNEYVSEGGYLSGESSAGGSVGGQNRGRSNLMLPGTRHAVTRSVSPMMMNQQQNSTSTSSLVLGRHNVSEQDQQLVSRGSSESVRRGSMGIIMSP
jgi:hypothetical protein